VDAGDIGAGHSVTALYDVTPVGGNRMIGDTRYGGPDDAEEAGDPESDERAYVKLRYKPVGKDDSKLVTTPVTSRDVVSPEDEGASARATRWAAAVAGFGQLLRGGDHMADFTFDDVIELGETARGEDPFSYRSGFLDLVRLAKTSEAIPDAGRSDASAPDTPDLPGPESGGGQDR